MISRSPWWSTWVRTCRFSTCSSVRALWDTRDWDFFFKETNGYNALHIQNERNLVLLALLAAAGSCQRSGDRDLCSVESAFMLGCILDLFNFFKYSCELY